MTITAGTSMSRKASATVGPRRPCLHPCFMRMALLTAPQWRVPVCVQTVRSRHGQLQNYVLLKNHTSAHHELHDFDDADCGGGGGGGELCGLSEKGDLSKDQIFTYNLVVFGFNVYSKTGLSLVLDPGSYSNCSCCAMPPVDNRRELPWWSISKNLPGGAIGKHSLLIRFLLAMDLALHRVSKRKRVRNAQCCGEYVLDVSQSTSGVNILSVSTWSHENEDSSLEIPIKQWEEVRGKRLASCATLDSRKGIVFAVFDDKRRYVTLDISDEGKEGFAYEKERSLSFKGPIFSVSTVSGVAAEGDGEVVIAVSVTGEIEMLCLTENSADVESRILDSLPVDKVISVSSSKEGGLFVTGSRNSKVLVLPLLLKRAESFATVSVQRPGAIQLPSVKKSYLPQGSSQEDSVVDILCDENYMVVLFTDGIVHLLRPPSSPSKPSKDTTGFGSWIDGEEGSSSHIVESCLERVFRLSPSISDDDPSMLISEETDQDCAGSVVRLNSNYFAVGYGRCVSIWDWTFHTGHGLVETDGNINLLCPSRHRASLMIACASGMQELFIAEMKRNILFSLGLAMSRKGVCDFIATDLHKAPHAVSMRAQPVTVSVTKLAAEAQGGASQLFRKRLEPLDEQEIKLANQLLNRTESDSPESIFKLTKRFTVLNNRLRRGNRGKYSNLGLSELPSERLAAATVARCLYEIHNGNATFVVPLIDMIGTGVVSSEAVLAVLGTSESWVGTAEREPLTLLSIVDPLLTSDIYVNALEAVIVRVADLPEPDVVRTLQYALRSTQAEFMEFADLKTSPQPGNAKKRFEKLSRMTNLILRCVTCHVDRERVIASLRQIPITDAIGILARLDHILNGSCDRNELMSVLTPGHAALPKPLGSVHKQFASLDELELERYRGVSNWMDNDAIRDAHVGKSGIDGCIEWSSHLIDAHLANLVMDKTGLETASRLLSTVQKRRREFEMIKGLHGLATHVLDRDPVPIQLDPLYSVSTLDVPAYASLQ